MIRRQKQLVTFTPILLQALKFVPNHRVLPEDFPTTFLEYLTPRSTLAPPHPSPLAAKLLDVEGVTSVFYGADFITVTKASDAQWAHIKPEVFSIITQAVTSGETIVATVEGADAESAQEGGGAESLVYDEEDDEVVGMIKELLETRIRPAIQEDGGDIELRGFENGIVMLKLRGACRTCDSSTVTLKNGIESMLMHYVRIRSHPYHFPCVGEFLLIMPFVGADRGSQGRRTGDGPGRGDFHARVRQVRGEAAPAKGRCCYGRQSTGHFAITLSRPGLSTVQ